MKIKNDGFDVENNTQKELRQIFLENRKQGERGVFDLEYAKNALFPR